MTTEHRRNASRRFDALRIAILTLPALMMISAGGCVTESGGTRNAGPNPWDNPQTMFTDTGISETTNVVAQIRPLGEVPYDNFALPLVSPDGRYIATQTGVAPTWATIIAREDAEVPAATQVEVYELNYRPLSDGRPDRVVPPDFVATLAEPVMLGRSCDEQGFLVESMRADGSRWIGKARWSDGHIDWLITGSEVNAFANLGPNQRLAWCQRDPETGRWKVLIQNRGQTFELGGPDEDWLMPTWTGRGSNLFVMVLRDEGVLELKYVIANSPAAVEQSMRTFKVTSAANVSTAYQMVAGQVNIADARPPRQDHLVFLHPDMKRMAMWRPLEVSAMSEMYLNRGSAFAVLDGPEAALVSTNGNLIRQSLEVDSDRSMLLAGLQIPRATTSSTVPWVLLSAQEGHVALTAMRLIEVQR